MSNFCFISSTGEDRAGPEPVEGACPELVEEACSEFIEGVVMSLGFYATNTPGTRPVVNIVFVIELRNYTAVDKILNVSNLNITLDGRQVLKNLSFSLERKQTLAVIGPNGSGKTVLLKSLLGLIPYSGEITWASDARIGYVPQKIDADIHLPMTANNLIHAKADIQKIKGPEISNILSRLKISPTILNTPIGHLSGGQFQKALVAFAMVGRPNVILFDEPTASLDQLAEEHVYDLMHELQTKDGISIILVSHELSVVYRYADQVLCLNREGVCFGPPEEALSPEVIHKLYSPDHALHHHGRQK